MYIIQYLLIERQRENPSDREEWTKRNLMYYFDISYLRDQ